MNIMTPGLNLVQRTVSAIVFVPIVLGLTWIGGGAFLTLIVGIVGRSCWEFYQLAENSGRQPLKLLGVGLSLILCVHLFLAPNIYFLLSIVIAAILVLIVTLKSGCSGFVDRASLTLGGIFYCGILGSIPLVMAVDTKNFRSTETGLVMVLIFASLWITDAVAYAAGRLWGQRKLAPSISPNKTILGAVVGSIAGLLPTLWQFLIPAFSHVELLGLFMVVALGGQMGDLVESAIKRDFGAKDAPTLIPGHGGALDRFDSYFFAFPLAYAYLVALQRLIPAG